MNRFAVRHPGPAGAKRRWLRRLLILLPILLGLLAGAHAFWWHSATRQLAEGVAAQLAMARAAGWSVNTGVPAPGGWPLAASLTVPELSISGGQNDIGGGASWSADRLVLEIGLLHPLLLGAEASGRQLLRVGAMPQIAYTAEHFRAVVPLQPGGPPRGFTLRVAGLRAGFPGAEGNVGEGGATLRSLVLQAGWTAAAKQNETALSVSVEARDVRLPPEFRWPFGPAVQSATAEFALNGPLPDGWPGGEDLAKHAAAWREAGGSFELRHLAVLWQALAVTASAKLALDAQLQPTGAGTLHVTNPDAGLDALRDSGTISDRTALAAKALLALLMHPAEGAAPVVDLPVTLQDRRISISRFGVARVPALTW